MVHLLEGDARGRQRRLHGGRVAQGEFGVLFEGFDEHPTAAPRQTGADKGVGVSRGEQSGFNANTTGEHEVAEFHHPWLTLIGSDQVGEGVPCCDDSKPLRRVRDNGGRGGQGDGRAWAALAHGANHLPANHRVEGLPPFAVKSMDVHRVRAGHYRGCGGLGDSGWRSGRGGVDAVAVEGNLQEGIGRQE